MTKKRRSLIALAVLLIVALLLLWKCGGKHVMPERGMTPCMPECGDIESASKHSTVKKRSIKQVKPLIASVDENLDESGGERASNRTAYSGLQDIWNLKDMPSLIKSDLSTPTPIALNNSVKDGALAASGCPLCCVAASASGFSGGGGSGGLAGGFVVLPIVVATEVHSVPEVSEAGLMLFALVGLIGLARKGKL